MRYNPEVKFPSPKVIRDVFAEHRSSPCAAHAALPCLSNSNSIEPPASNRFNNGHRRLSHALQVNVKGLCSRYGLSHLAFLTLTFSDHVTSPSEASRRRNSFFTNFLRYHVLDYICVLEPTKSGRCHYHLIVALPFDVRSGVDMARLFASKPDYSTVPSNLRHFWKLLRENAPLYGFGRTECLPIKKNADALGYYVGKYVSKSVESRPARFRFARLVTMSVTARTATTAFQFVCEASRLWRRKVTLFSFMVCLEYRLPFGTTNLASVLGKQWHYRWREDIVSMDCDAAADVIAEELAKVPF